MLNNIFKFLLIIYPPILIWNEEQFFVINRIIGISFILLFLLKFLIEKQVVDRKLAILISVFFVFVLISTIVNNSFNLINLNIMIKYITSFIVGYYTLCYVENKFIKLFFNYYFWLIFFTWLIRFAQYGFPFTSVTLIREELWWGKPVVFGLLYSIFYVGYILINQDETTKFRILKFLLAIPMLFMGSRSVIIGGVFILIVYLLKGLNFKPRNIKISVFLILLIGSIANTFLFEFISANEFLSNFLGSEKDLTGGNEATLSSFSSGRTDVWSLYIDRFELINLFFGYGGLNFDIGFSLHNDLLEIFFFYGIFSIISFVILLYYVYLREGIKSQDTLRTALMFFIVLQFLFNPFSSTMSASFFVIVILNFDYGKLS
jgi:hypothetical protein